MSFQYLDFGRHGTAKSSFTFLKTELLVRLANIMKVIFAIDTYSAYQQFVSILGN